MTPEQFAYWLRGFTELTPDMPVPSPAQWQAIKDHLETVFVKVTPPLPGIGPVIASPARPFENPKLLQDYLFRPNPLLGEQIQVTC